jgi:hypothetical protein
MAFQAPTRARQLTLSRHQSYQEGHSSSAAALSSSAAAGTAPLSAAATEEWVVFSPTTPGGAVSTILTGGTNRESDVGSSITASSPRAADARYDAIGAFDEGTLEDDGEEEEEESLDGAETDSLQPFREDQGHVLLPTLPTHDGLGTFSSSGASGFRSLEESLRIVAAFGQGEEGNDTHSRIQKWRMEQGHVLMDEIEKATRRRRRLSLASRHSGPEAKLDEAPNMVAGDEKPSSQPTSVAATETQEDNESETFWKRITRSFIRDIIGIDDQLLEVLFGEALPAEAQLDSSAEEAQFKKDAEERILNRIAKELGELVHLYTQHPSGTGAFSTQPKQSEEPEADGAKTPQPRPSTTETAPPKPQSPASATSSVPQFQFVPTLALRPEEEEEASHAALWGIEEEDTAQLRHDYWEQELDVHLVFSYLKSRFYRAPKTTTAPSSVITHPSTPPPLHHHHPLLNRKPSYYIPNRSQPKPQPPAPKATTSVAAMFAPLIGGGGSCAVAKERRSSKASSRSRGYYWDVATSVGSGQSSCVGTGVWAAI